jgi:hypothetical protein
MSPHGRQVSRRPGQRALKNPPPILRETKNFVAYKLPNGVRIAAKNVAVSPRGTTIKPSTWDILSTMSDSEFDGSVVLELGVGSFRRGSRSQRNPAISVPADLREAAAAVMRWGYFAAKPYAQALLQGDTGFDDVSGVLAYLRSNIAQWKGPEAKAAKAVIDKYIKARWRGAAVSATPAPKQLWQTRNPGRSVKRVTMPLAKFASWVKAKRNPKLWAAFMAKVEGYKKWTHGTMPKNVTMELINAPGVEGTWITYGAGKQPEALYTMPGGSKRKGAWRHPWETPADLRHDPEAGVIFTKLRGKSRITDFYHK